MEQLQTPGVQAALRAIRGGEADCVVLRRDGVPVPGHGRGVRPLLQFLEHDPDTLAGALLVDKIVGKAAAMLAVLGGVRQVVGLTVSTAGRDYLAGHGVLCTAVQTVDYVTNRTGDGLCPLEQSVLSVEDPAVGLARLKMTIARLMAAKDKEKDAIPEEKKMEEQKDYLGRNIKKLGFGLMRLPMLGSEVDIEQTKKMVDLFMAAGFTYFDTAYGYIDGKSEQAAKTALVDRYPRSSFTLATKLPAWAGPKTAEEAKQMFWTSLERTGAGYFDFYLLHNLGDDRTHYFDDYGIWDFVAEQKKKGLIRHVGFSMHDKAEALDRILTEHPEVEFVQLQINYADWESPTVESRKCYETARRHNKPVVIMEPVKGGALAGLPDPIADILRSAEPGASLSSWAVRFAASHEGIITVLSGMSNIAQVQDNVATMEHFKPLTEAEQAVIKKVQQALAAVPSVPCTGCSYCTKGCPQGIAIPGIFRALNGYLVYGNLESARGGYGWETRDGGVASKCVACGQCESVCPQHISIISELQRAAELLEK